VRYDLVGAKRATIELAFLRENLFRRDQDAMAKARAALRVFELQKCKGKLSASRESEAREQIARMLNWSGRTLVRYWHVLKTPVEVQNAVRAKKLKLVEAEQVCWLDAQIQTQIAMRILNGEEPNEVVSEFVSRAAPKQYVNRLQLMVVGLGRALAHVGDRIDQFTSHELRGYLPALCRAQEVIDDLIGRAALAGSQTDEEPAGGEEE
jgi:hypothetical protein